MGDIRFAQHYERLRSAANRIATLRTLTDEEVVEALAHASRERDPLLANVLATDLANRLKRARLVMDTVEESVLGLDRDGRVAFANATAERAMGRRAGEMRGLLLSELLKIDAMPSRKEAPLLKEAPDILSSLTTRSSIRIDACSLALPGGRSMLADVRATPILVDDDVTGVVVSFHETGPMTSWGWFEAVMASTEEAIIAKTLDGIITAWNPAAERMYGYTEEEALGRNVDLLIVEHKEESALMARIAQGERIGRYSTLRRRKDGEIVEVEVSLSPVRDRDGRIVGVSHASRPIQKAGDSETEARRLATLGRRPSA